MEKLNLHQLRRQRMKQYWFGIAPYCRYVGGSLPGFMLIIGFSFYGYGQFVNHLPDRFPTYALIAVLLLIPVSSFSLRTYLRDADVVFLLPMEVKMSEYLKPCIRSAFVSHVVSLSLIWYLLWPLFQAAGGQSAVVYGLIWLQLVLIKGVVIYGGWFENQIRDTRTRLIIGWLRSILIGILIYLVLITSITWSLLLIGVAAITYMLILRATARFSIHWERLIVLEKKSRSRWITLFNLFVEVPREHSPVRQTRWLHQMARMLTFKKSNAYRYLYLLTWIRSDLFGVVARLTLLGVLFMAMMNSIWIKLVLLAVFAYVTRLQLKELERYHKNVEVSSIYPVEHDLRAGSARSIARRVHVAIIAVLLGSFLVMYWIH